MRHRDQATCRAATRTIKPTALPLFNLSFFPTHSLLPNPTIPKKYSTEERNPQSFCIPIDSTFWHTVRRLCFETFNFKASRCYTGRGRPTTVLPSPLQRPQSVSVPPAARARSPRKFEAGTRSPRPGAPEPAPGSYTSLQLRSTTSCTFLLYSRLHSLYSRAASELAGELGLGSHSRLCIEVRMALTS